MSIFHAATVTCPKCGAPAQIQRCASINADRRPDYRAAILDGSFQATACASCGAALRLPPHLTYLEVSRKCWIAAEPVTMLEQWPEVEREVFETYSQAFGEQAPAAAQELGDGLRPRLVFGWPAFREKLICQDLQVDDVTLELLKIAIMREVNRPPLAAETELRLVGGDAESLHFQWVVTLSEKALASLTVPRDIYDSIIEEPEPWQDARDKFDHVFLVDLRRLIAGPALAEAAD